MSVAAAVQHQAEPSPDEEFSRRLRDLDRKVAREDAKTDGAVERIRRAVRSAEDSKVIKLPPRTKRSAS